jgi:hypothetical protein
MFRGASLVVLLGTALAGPFEHDTLSVAPVFNFFSRARAA